MDLLKTAKRSAVTFTLLIMFSTFCSADIIHKYQGEFDLPIPKPDSDPKKSTKGWMEDAVIQIPEHLIINDLDVGVSISHSSVFDLQLFLRSPVGTTICLNRYNFDEFFTGANYLNSIFDDEAESAIESAQPPFAGRFKPKSPALLQSFYNEDAFGTWELRVYDSFWSDSGTLKQFELYITTPEPRSAMLFILCALGIIILKPKHSR